MTDTHSAVALEGLPEPLVIHQFYLGCLSQAAYLVGDRSTGRAIVVDPRRDVDEVLAVAAAEGLKIELVVQTHFHADFISGHLEMAAATGAEIGYGAAARTEFPSRALADGEIIDLGTVKVEIWSTPGHTPESISLVIHAGPGEEPTAVLTGDALFIGDVGRPDLLVAADIPAADLAAQLFDSVHRIAGLPEQTLVLPAHGAGSACGKSLSSETVSTIGAQRATNYALAPTLSRQQFIDIVTEGQPAAPGYFGHDAQLNRLERPLLDENEPVTEVDLATLDAAVARGAAVVDTRPVNEFAAGHLAGALHVSLDGRFAEQVGSVVPFGSEVVLVGDAQAAAEARRRLARIGFDRVVGTLTDVSKVLSDHPERARRLSRLTVTELGERQQSLGERLQFVDVRNPGEVEDAPVPGAHNIPLARLSGELGQLRVDEPVVLVCAGGARSAIASSLLLANGFADVSDVLGGALALGVDATCLVAPAQ